ncbi:protein Aster-B-like isoform X2 [Chironomus tepperi]|uniref:protein Aster-B-like isoform X2 n=1 Tax=Chironomus tepperi TaxID=113505 RepID=UPI00391FBDE5
MNFHKKDYMKKSVDDLISSSQDVFNQAISLTSIKRSPSPKKLQLQHKRDKSDVSNDNLDLDMRQSTTSSATTDTSASPETSKSQDDLKDSKRPSSTLGEKAKKKAWYNVIYPSYKSRSDDFKKLFSIPEDERLLVDYSCAIQKDILVHGRLYVSQNYVCFHANIIVYETRFVLKWKDVKSISKEKVAKVIPNAILLTTETEKHFLTSFTSRDKAYLMLFRIWQNALMDKSYERQELWQWVHTCYGEQLGLTTDDEDYIDPTNYEERENQYSADSVSEEPEAKISSSSSNNKLTNDEPVKSKKELKKLKKSSSSSSLSNKPIAKEFCEKNSSIDVQSQIINPELLPTDMSDSSSDSEAASKMDNFINDAECDSIHEGRQLVHTILPLNIETVFNLLFDKSKFFSEFHKMRRTTNLVQGEWEDQEDGSKKRIQTLTVAITQVIGPKQAHVTETQLMRTCSKQGLMYSIDATSENAGIPYADSFYVLLHYCMKRTFDDATVMSVHAQIKYKKSVWGVVKGFIEKNTWLGLEDFYDSLSQALMQEYNMPKAKAKRRTRKSVSHTNQILPNINIQTSLPIKQISKDETQLITRQTRVHDVRQVDSIKEPIKNVNKRQERLSWIVIFLLITLISFNVILYVKLWRIDDSDTSDIIGQSSPPKNTAEWMKLIKLQEKLHFTEMLKWQEVIQSTIELLKKTENSLSDLQNLILSYRQKSSD